MGWKETTGRSEIPGSSKRNTFMTPDLRKGGGLPGASGESGFQGPLLTVTLSGGDVGAQTS